MLVKVHNLNIYDFKQKIGDDEYKIKAGGYIELEEDDANKLVKRMFPMQFDANNQQTPQSFKKLKIDEDDLKRVRALRENKAKSGNYVCMLCGYVASNKWELNGHSLDQHRASFDDEDAALEQIEADKKTKPKRTKKEPDELQEAS